MYFHNYLKTKEDIQNSVLMTQDSPEPIVGSRCPYVNLCPFTIRFHCHI